MKIGIITEPLVDNYGGILQNFALQRTLVKLGHDPITLDYLPSLSFGRYLLYAAKSALTSAIKFKRPTIKPYHHFAQRPTYVKDFIAKNIATTDRLERYTKNAVRKAGCDALIVGSDQVWRKDYNEHLEDMFLNFAGSLDIKRISYAASFGIQELDYSKEQQSIAKKLLSSFDSLSVREASGKTICKKYLGTEAQIVLDPTLLLDRAEYDSLCGQQANIRTPYVAAYVLDMTDEKLRAIESFAKEKGIESNLMTVSCESVTSIEEWINSFRNADYVITDSFHGTVFSILFQKQFISLGNKERGNDRFQTLLSSLQLEERLSFDINEIMEKMEHTIDYGLVAKLIEEKRAESIHFLRNSLI